MTEQHECPRCKTRLTLENTQRFDTITCAQCQRQFIPAEDRVVIEKMGKYFRRVLWIAFLLFGWSKFHGVDFVDIAKQLDADLLLRFSMVLYYLCWSYGANWDTAGMQSNYAVAPNRGRIPLSTIGTIAALVCGGVILWLVHTVNVFAAVLAIFWVLNIGAWVLILRRTVEPTVTVTVHGFRDKLKWYDRLESLLAFDEQHRGSWQWWRWGVGLLLLIFINVLAFSPLSQIIGDAAGGIPGETIVALSVLIFIVAMEGWIWLTRLRSNAYQRAISELAQKYNLSPKTPMTVLASTSAATVVQPSSASK